MNSLPAILTIKDAASYLRRSTKTIYRRIEAGQIRSYREGQEHRIRREWLLEYEAACIGKGGEPMEPRQTKEGVTA